MITPHEAIADVATVAAHYDDLDLFYRTIWGTHVHHGYWKTGKENRQEAVLNLTRLVAKQAGVQAGDRVCDYGLRLRRNRDGSRPRLQSKSNRTDGFTETI